MSQIELPCAAIQAAVREYGSLGAAAVALGISRAEIAAILRQSGTKGASAASTTKAPPTSGTPLATPGQTDRRAKTAATQSANLADYLAASRQGKPNLGHDLPAKPDTWPKRVEQYLRDREGARALKCGHAVPQKDCTYCVRILCGFEWRLKNRKRPLGEKKGGRPVQHNMVGETWANLKVIALTKRRYRGHVIYVCRCVCGTEIDVTRRSLVTGNTKSCGCVGRQEGPQRRAANLGSDQLSIIAQKSADTKRKVRRQKSLDEWREKHFGQS